MTLTPRKAGPSFGSKAIVNAERVRSPLSAEPSEEEDADEEAARDVDGEGSDGVVPRLVV